MKKHTFTDDTGHVVYECTEDSTWCNLSQQWMLVGCLKCDGCTAAHCRFAGLNEKIEEVSDEADSN